METTLELVIDGAPDIKRLTGSPGIEGGHNLTNDKNLDLTETAKWEVSHWQVRHEDDDDVYLRENRVAQCKVEVNNDSTFKLSPSAQLRHEDFGCTVFIGGNVYALNRAGETLLQKIQKFSVEEVIKQNTGQASQSIFSFVGKLCSIGVLVP